MSFSDRPRRIPPQLRRLVWERYMPDPKSAYGPCAVCEAEIHIMHFECGHVISHVNGGEITIENLRPICGPCNKSMGPMNLEVYKARFFSPPSDPMELDELIEDFSRLTLSPDEERCPHILVKGRNKGARCGKKIKEFGYCTAHISDYFRGQ